MNDLKIMNILGVECYEKDGTAFLKLETVARGLGFTRIADSGNKVVRWERVEKYLSEFGVPTCGHDGFIPENIFYRLAMKAKNAVAEAFQAKIADEVIPSIRRTGGYISGQEEMPAEELMARALTVAQKVLADREARLSALTIQNQIMQPKADYFDELVERNTLTNFRETAKEIGAKPRALVKFLLEKKYIYLDQRGKLMPYQPYVDSGLFEMKECYNDKTSWSGTQTLVTPKGRETFRLLFN